MNKRPIGFLIAWMLIAPAAQASDVAVLPVIATDVASQDLAQVESALRRALVAKKRHLVDPAQIDRIFDLLPSTCSKRHCFKEIATKLDPTVTLQLGARLKKADGNWQLDLLMHYRKQQSEPAKLVTATGRCNACKSNQLGPFAERLVTTLFKNAQAIERPAYLEVRSNPPGAVVTINNVPMGATNTTFGVIPGRHTIALKKDGYKISVHNVEVEPGAHGKIVAELEAEATPPRNGDDDNPAFARSFRWVTLGAAVASLGVGIALIAIDGKGTCDLSPIEPEGWGRCPERYKTRALGVTFTVIGGATAVGSAIFFYLAAKDRRGGTSTARALVPWASSRGAGLSYLSRF